MSRIILHVITGYSAITTYVPKQMTWADTSDLDFHTWEDGLKEVLPTCTVQLFAEAADQTEKPTFYLRFVNVTNYFARDHRLLCNYYVLSKADDMGCQ